MKKASLSVVSCIILCMLAVTGCGNASTKENRETELEKKITQLEERITELETQKVNNSIEENINTTKPPVENQETSTTVSNDTVNNVKNPDAETDNSNTEAENAQNQEVITAGSGETDDSQKNLSNENIEDLKEEVRKWVQIVDSVAPSADPEKRKTEFLDLKQQGNQLEKRLDLYEDFLENEYRQGNVSYEEFRMMEGEIDGLEEQLDNAEDKLELSFGLDD